MRLVGALGRLPVVLWLRFASFVAFDALVLATFVRCGGFAVLPACCWAGFLARAFGFSLGTCAVGAEVVTSMPRAAGTTTLPASALRAT